jgi:hypothetical protein
VLFEITSITASNGVAIIAWNSVSNQPYVLEYKDDFTSTNWLEASSTVVATSSNTAVTNIVGEAVQRYYRVKQGTAFQRAAVPEITSIIVNGDSVTLTWNSVAGQVYRLQYKDDFTSAWTDILPDVTADGPTTSLTVSGAGASQRFYQVTLP